MQDRWTYSFKPFTITDVAGPPRPAAKKVTQVGLGPAGAGAPGPATPTASGVDGDELLSDDDLVSESLPPASDVVRAQEREPELQPDNDPDAYLKLEEGKILARKYRLVKPAGFGGMAQLWVAKNESTAAEVCVKILVPDPADHESVARFRREAHAAARLSHRAIVSVFDLFELDVNGHISKAEHPHALAIVMELLTGETLTDHLMKQGELHVDDMLDIAIPMCGALAHAHKAGVVHRDIKPDNVFLARDPDGTVIPKVLDFGVSKIVSSAGGSEGLTKTGVMLGTPSFMSPEQAKGSPDVDARSDVFSAGIVMMMMLTGKNPFEDEGGFHSIVQNIIEKPVTRPEGLSDTIWDVINRALLKDPDARWNDGTELQIALRKASGRRSLSEPGMPVAPLSTNTTGSQKAAAPAMDTGSTGMTGSQEMAIPGVDPERRARMIKIVAGIVMASFLIVGIALIRAALSASPKDAEKPAPAKTAATTSAAPPPAATTAAPTVTAAATTTTASTTTAPTTATPPSTAAGATATATAPIETATATAATTTAAPKPNPKPASPKVPAKTDPNAIARDPGF